MLLSFYILAIWIKLFGISWSALIIIWITTGIGYSSVLTPIGRIIRKSSDGSDFSQLYAAQFSLSHACWLVMYPFSGWVMTIYGSIFSLIAVASIILISTVIAFYSWTSE